jgi:hypothetical protein
VLAEPLPTEYPVKGVPVPDSDSAGWEELPAAVRQGIEQHAGPVTATEAHGEGVSTSVRLILRTRGGSVFAKGTGPDADDFERDRLTLGAALAPHVAAVSPPLLWRVTADGWDITGWPLLPGRPRASLAPGSPDIPAVVGILQELAEIQAPSVPMWSTGKVWGFDDPGFGGGALVHTDPHPANFVIDGSRAWMVDFGWAMRGPAWVTSARIIPHLIDEGWPPADAERVLSVIPAWASAPPGTVSAYVADLARSFEKSYRQRPGNPHRRRWHEITRAWADHRAELS